MTLSLMLLACAEPTFYAPLHGSTVSSDQIAVVVHELDIPAPDLLLKLDDEDVTDPEGLWHDAGGRSGGGSDWIGLLTLTELEPGPHRLTAWRAGARRAVSDFVWDPPPCRLDVSVRDGDGQPVYARIALRDADGAPASLSSPAATAVDPRERDVEVDSFFAVAGQGSVHLPCGTWRVIGIRGVRDAVAEQSVELTGRHSVELDIPRLLDTPGEFAADLHVHTGRSLDSFIPHTVRWWSLAAAGLEWVVASDHGLVTDPVPSMQRVLDGAGPTGVPGVEQDVYLWDEADDVWQGRAHVNAFPLDVDAELSEGRYDSLDAVLSELRALPAPEEPILQLNHPRGVHFDPDETGAGNWALFSQLGLSRSEALGEGANALFTREALAYDSLEVINRFSLDRYRETRKDWFALLNQGLWLTGTGNSDSHAMTVELAGFPVNLVAASPGDLGAFGAALRKGQVRVSTGPLVELSLGSASPGDQVTGSGHTATVRVRAAPWVPVDEIRLIVDGDELATFTPDARDEAGLLDSTHELELELSGDGWVIAEAGWPLAQAWDPDRLGLYADVAPGYVPVGFTNPIRVDADGDGKWTPQGASAR